MIHSGAGSLRHWIKPRFGSEPHVHANLDCVETVLELKPGVTKFFPFPRVYNLAIELNKSCFKHIS